MAKPCAGVSMCVRAVNCVPLSFRMAPVPRRARQGQHCVMVLSGTVCFRMLKVWHRAPDQGTTTR
eukprot:1046070-Rhodomonas_salina.1